MRAFFILVLLVFSKICLTQKIECKVKLISTKDSLGRIVVSLISDKTCYVNIEKNYLGLTNSPNEFFLDIVDTNYNSLLNDEQGSHGHWFMPIIGLSLEQNDSLFHTISKRFYEEKKRNEFISSPKMLLLLKNKKYGFIINLD